MAGPKTALAIEDPSSVRLVVLKPKHHPSLSTIAATAPARETSASTECYAETAMTHLDAIVHDKVLKAGRPELILQQARHLGIMNALRLQCLLPQAAPPLIHRHL